MWILYLAPCGVVSRCKYRIFCDFSLVKLKLSPTSCFVSSIEIQPICEDRAEDKQVESTLKSTGSCTGKHKVDQLSCSTLALPPPTFCHGLHPLGGQCPSKANMNTGI